jgi:hypothetical protein
VNLVSQSLRSKQPTDSAATAEAVRAGAEVTAQRSPT